MKIIKYGYENLRDMRIGRITCHHCQTIFEFEKWEATEITRFIYKIKCPDCERNITFDSIIFTNK